MPRVHIGGLGQLDDPWSFDTGNGASVIGPTLSTTDTSSIPFMDVSQPPAPSSPTYTVLNNPTLSPINATQALQTSGLTSSIVALASPTAPSPRVSTVAAPSILTSSTLFPGIPDIMTIGIAAVALLLLTSGKKRR